MEPLPKLQLTDDLKVKVPKSEINWAKKDIFIKILGQKKELLGERYTDYQFQFDIGWLDPEICTIMQIVDDNTSFKNSRRDNILSCKTNYVGICNQRIGKKNCVYILFAKKAKKELD